MAFRVVIPSEIIIFVIVGPFLLVFIFVFVFLWAWIVD